MNLPSNSYGIAFGDFSNTIFLSMPALNEIYQAQLFSLQPAATIFNGNPFSISSPLDIFCTSNFPCNIIQIYQQGQLIVTTIPSALTMNSAQFNIANLTLLNQGDLSASLTISTSCSGCAYYGATPIVEIGIYSACK